MIPTHYQTDQASIRHNSLRHGGPVRPRPRKTGVPRNQKVQVRDNRLPGYWREVFIKF